MSRKLTVSVRTQDMWVLETLEKIVAAKTDMGFRTSLSYELIRTAKNGLTSGLIGVDLDRQILLGGTDEFT